MNNHKTRQSRVVEWARLVGASVPDSPSDDRDEPRPETSADRPT